MSCRMIFAVKGKHFQIYPFPILLHTGFEQPKMGWLLYLYISPIALLYFQFFVGTEENCLLIFCIRDHIFLNIKIRIREKQIIHFKLVFIGYCFWRKFINRILFFNGSAIFYSMSCIGIRLFENVIFMYVNTLSTLGKHSEWNNCQHHCH